MHAYSQVDMNVRRKLEEMLKTWREPVPGSSSTTPVFPISSTQSIVDNLNKFRAATAANPRYQGTPVQGGPARVASAQQSYRQTPTPPQSAVQYPPALPTHIRSPQPHSVTPTISGQPYSQAPLNSYAQPHTSQPSPYYQLPQQNAPAPTAQFRSLAASQYSIPSGAHATSSGPVDIQKLHVDIDDLTTDAKIECATHPMDQAAQRHLTTLQTLKEILDSGSTSEEDLINIRNTIMQQMSDKLAAVRQNAALASTSMQLQQQYATPQPQIQHTHAPPITAPSIFNTANLAELLRATANQPQQQQQHQAKPQPNFYSQQHPGGHAPLLSGLNPSPAPPAVTENPLLAQLRASGLLSLAPTPTQGLTPPLSALANFATDTHIEVSFTSAAIKIPRPHLMQTFLKARPNQCSTCGRRFTSDGIGREKRRRISTGISKRRSGCWRRRNEGRIGVGMSMKGIGLPAKSTKTMQDLWLPMERQQMERQRMQRRRLTLSKRQRTQLFDHYHVQLIKNLSKVNGVRKCRTLSGRTPFMLAADTTTQAAMPKSPRVGIKTGFRRLGQLGEPPPQTRY